MIRQRVSAVKLMSIKFALPTSLKTIIAPPSTVILALRPLPSLPSYSLALALISTPNGSVLRYIDLTSDSFAPVGDETPLGDMSFNGEVGMIVSQGVDRGHSGLVALISNDIGGTLVVAPPITRA